MGEAMSVIEPDVRTRMLPGTGRFPVRVGVVSDTYDNRDALKQLLDHSSPKTLKFPENLDV